jgi:3-demethoxyubiquinol 3-hydroxylase
LREVVGISPDSGSEGKKTRSKVAIIRNIQLFRCEFATHLGFAKALRWRLLNMTNLYQSVQRGPTVAQEAAKAFMGKTSSVDDWVAAADTALRTLFAPARASAPAPIPVSIRSFVTDDSYTQKPPPVMTASERRHAAGLMRVNHVGEVCAQALYSAQALGTSNAHLKQQFRQAAAEELDHLAWTEQRIKSLGGRTSLLNPAWYVGAFALGLMASRSGDAVSLGFLQETETQVADHLRSHLQEDGAGGLPVNDVQSRAIAAQMCSDEERHALWAAESGAAQLPKPVSLAMKGMAKLMTTTAYKI